MDAAPETLTELALLVRALAHVHNNVVAKREIAVPPLVQTCFDAMVLASELQSDAANVTPAYLRAAADLLRQAESVRPEIALTTPGVVVPPWRLVILSYVAILGAVFDAEGFGSGEESGDDLVEVNRQVRRVIDGIRLEELLAQMVIPETSSFARVAALMFIRSCAAGSILGERALYVQVLSLCSLSQELVEVYLAASIIKLDSVATLVGYSNLSDEQFACLSLLDMFNYLAGVRIG
jgi:hypothetical protein